MGKIWTDSRRHLVISYTRYTTRFSLRSNLVAPLEIKQRLRGHVQCTLMCKSCNIEVSLRIGVYVRGIDKVVNEALILQRLELGA